MVRPERQSPAGRPGSVDSAKFGGFAVDNGSTSGGNLSTLLASLESVTQHGDRYRARCPAHGGRSTSSLSIREISDGRILVHCFGGCDTESVVQAVGLTLADLMPPRLDTHRATPTERARWREHALHRQWCEVAEDLLREASVVYVASEMLRAGQVLNDADSARLDQALDRITRAREVLNER